MQLLVQSAVPWTEWVSPSSLESKAKPRLVFFNRKQKEKQLKVDKGDICYDFEIFTHVPDEARQALSRIQEEPKFMVEVLVGSRLAEVLGSQNLGLRQRSRFTSTNPICNFGVHIYGIRLRFKANHPMITTQVQFKSAYFTPETRIEKEDIPIFYTPMSPPESMESSGSGRIYYFPEFADEKCILLLQADGKTPMETTTPSVEVPDGDDFKVYKRQNVARENRLSPPPFAKTEEEGSVGGLGRLAGLHGLGDNGDLLQALLLRQMLQRS